MRRQPRRRRRRRRKQRPRPRRTRRRRRQPRRRRRRSRRRRRRRPRRRRRWSRRLLRARRGLRRRPSRSPRKDRREFAAPSCPAPRPKPVADDGCSWWRQADQERPAAHEERPPCDGQEGTAVSPTRQRPVSSAKPVADNSCPMVPTGRRRKVRPQCPRRGRRESHPATPQLLKQDLSLRMATLCCRQANEKRSASNGQEGTPCNGEEGTAGHEEEGAAGDAQVAGAVNLVVRTCKYHPCSPQTLFILRPFCH